MTFEPDTLSICVAVRGAGEKKKRVGLASRRPLNTRCLPGHHKLLMTTAASDDHSEVVATVRTPSQGSRTKDADQARSGPGSLAKHGLGKPGRTGDHGPGDQGPWS